MKQNYTPDIYSNISGDDAPLISIVTITFNAEKEIPATLKSIREQSWKDFEHIVIDGASSDHTVDIVKQKSPDSLIVSEPDRGLYDAMNKGLRQARGKYVLFLNAGDTFHSADTLSLYAEAIATDPEADIIYGDTDIVDSERRYLRPRHLNVPQRLDFDSFKNGMLVCHQAFMVRKAIAPEYDLTYRFSADYDWTLKCLRKSDSAHNINLQTVVIDYLDAGLTDRNHRASLKERFRIMARNYGLLPTLLRHLRFLLRHLARRH